MSAVTETVNRNKNQITNSGFFFFFNNKAPNEKHVGIHGRYNLYYLYSLISTYIKCYNHNFVKKPHK